MVFFFFIFIMVIGVMLFMQKLKGAENTKNSQKISSVSSSAHPLDILSMREADYTVSTITKEEKLTATTTYDSYIVSYLSDGFKVYALLTIPKSEKPKEGFPVIIFNHGFIPPKEYKTTEKYEAYVDFFARQGYIVFKSDYRGNGKSEGEASGPYFSENYHRDVLNAVQSIKHLSEANPNAIGMWGHSMGGNITMRSIVVNNKDIKAAVLWAPVAASYNTMFSNFFTKHETRDGVAIAEERRKRREELIKKYGTPETNPAFYNSVDPTNFLQFVTTPVQIHHGTADETVDITLSKELNTLFKKQNKFVEYYEYIGGNHNLSGAAFDIGMGRAKVFFAKYLKGQLLLPSN
jgi:uncharacterized protein